MLLFGFGQYAIQIMVVKMILWQDLILKYILLFKINCYCINMFLIFNLQLWYDRDTWQKYSGGQYASISVDLKKVHVARI